MDFQTMLEKNKNIQRSLIEYVDGGNEHSYNQLNELIKNLIEEDPIELKSILQLINALYNNHHRSPEFFDRIEKIILHYKTNFQQFLSDKDYFNFSKFNNKLILFLHQEKIISVSDYNITSFPSEFYFYPEIKSDSRYDLHYIKEKYEEFDPETFEKNRKIGENHSKICSLIRNDSIAEFISYVNQTNLQLTSKIGISLFETNEFLKNQRETSLIEYATFFGSIQIFKYLLTNKVELPPSLWLYAIHSNNPEIISLLEENRVKLLNIKEKIYEKKRELNFNFVKEEYFKQFILLLIEAIKCHHNDIFNYLMEINNDDKGLASFFKKWYKFDYEISLEYIQSYEVEYDEKDKDYNAVNMKYLYPCIFENFNYDYFPEKMDDQLLFYYFVTYGYTSFVDYFLKEKNIDINKINVSNFF